MIKLLTKELNVGRIKYFLKTNYSIMFLFLFFSLILAKIIFVNIYLTNNNY